MSVSDGKDGSASVNRSEVAFFGKITASVTHELNNVISIIEQTAGLLDDLVAGEERGVPINLNRLGEISGSVQKQAQRGLRIIGRLNKFAHSTDHSHTRFDVSEEVGNLAELLQRLAGLRRLQLEYIPGETAVQITGNPFAVLRAVFAVVGVALEQGRSGSKVTVQTQEDRGAVVAVRYAAGKPLEEHVSDELKTVIQGAGGDFTVEDEAGERVLLLSFSKHGEPGRDDSGKSD